MWRGLATAGVLCTAIALVAFSQERRGPGPGTGGFGPGGDMSLMLIGMPEVRQELGIKESQHKDVDDWMAQTQEEMRAPFASLNFQELESLTPEERDAKLAEVRGKSEAAAKAAIERLGKFLEPAQISRFRQLRWQREGVLALNRDDVAGELNLTEKQRRSLRELPVERFQPFAPPEARQQAQSDALAILTDAQESKWAELQGKEFAFPEFGRGGFGPGGPGGPGFGPGGPRGPGGMGQERKVVAQFDKDGDGRLDREERLAARDFLKKERASGGGLRFGPGGVPGGPGRGPGFGPGFGGPGGPGGPGFGRRDEPSAPGPKLSPADVKPVADAGLYEPTVLRTLFLEFADEDWEAELADFNNTDVEVPATVTVDGVKYPNVGVHFRGMSSFMAVGAGSKRSLNLTFDFVDDKQRLYGYKTLNLLNSHEDPTFLHTVLYLAIARQYIAAPKANFVKLAINGESWGVYVNAQQYNKDFLTDNYDDSKGARWKVTGSPGGRGGLEFLGDDLAQYKARYTLKTRDSDKDWKALVKLCKTLNETPADKLEEALEPILDIDGALWFLALENALINSDGYWIRASDYCIYRDSKGKFHIIPHDANETFQPGMGPGMGGPGGPGMGGPPGLFGGFPGPGGGGPGGPRDRENRRPPGEGEPNIRPQEGRQAEGRPEGRPGEGRPRDGQPGRDRGPGGPGGPRGGGGGVELDPLIGLNDASKPLRSKLLAVPSLKAKYLAHVKTIAEDWLDWQKLQPMVDQYVQLIDAEVKADTKKLSSYDAFQQTVSSKPQQGQGGNQMGLKTFADQRRNFLLNHPEIKALKIGVGTAH